MFDRLREDVRCVFDRDPAARTTFEVLTTYPGLHAVLVHRLSHGLWNSGLKWLARFLSMLMRWLTGIEIHPGARIGRRLFIDHGMGVVIGETAEVGSNVTLYHGVTLGGTSLSKGKRHPTVEDRVTIGAGAKVLGNINIGSDSRIGANAVVVKSVPENSVVIGVPGQIVKRTQPHLATDAPDLNHTLMPDIIGITLKDLLQRVEELEGRVDGHPAGTPYVYQPSGDAWEEIEYAI